MMKASPLSMTRETEARSPFRIREAASSNGRRLWNVYQVTWRGDALLFEHLPANAAIYAKAYLDSGVSEETIRERLGVERPRRFQRPEGWTPFDGVIVEDEKGQVDDVCCFF